VVDWCLISRRVMDHLLKYALPSAEPEAREARARGARFRWARASTEVVIDGQGGREWNEAQQME
jgi:hypothetical protein